MKRKLTELMKKNMPYLMKRNITGLWSSFAIAILAFGLGTITGGNLPFALLSFSNAPAAVATPSPNTVSGSIVAMDVVVPGPAPQVEGTPVESGPAEIRREASARGGQANPSMSVEIGPDSNPAASGSSAVTGGQVASQATGQPDQLGPTVAVPTPTAAIQTPPTAPAQASKAIAPKRIGLQAGHWQTADQPDELASLRTSTGAQGKGWTEQQINLEIARRAASLLEASGFKVDILPAKVPVQYKADAFLSLHGDANGNTSARGFKLARASRSAIPTIDDALVATVYAKYGEITGIPRNDNHITNNMRYYYAFAGSRTQHAVAPTTPSAILEMGFLTNGTDRGILMGQPDLIARAVAESLTQFLNR